MTEVFINGRKYQAQPGQTILELARLNGEKIESPCNGNGTCGKCKAIVDGETVLACMYRIDKPIDIKILSKESENKSIRILRAGVSAPVDLKPSFDTGYGVVVDIGTTTLVVSLIDLKSGKEIGTDSCINPQTAIAQDVLSRISFASEPGGLKTLQDQIVGAMREIIGNLAKAACLHPTLIREAVYSGNTAMLHLACGADPESLGKYPYNLNLECGRSIPADNLGISGNLYLPPVISAFVGADITAGILASRLYEQKLTTLFIDIGTNGEMVIAKDGELAATSTAAGPAFEGMNIDCGMRAANGAIEKFKFEEIGSFTYQVIGGTTPVGICGSGLLDIVAELVRTKRVGKSGRFANKKKQFDITDKVRLTQSDIRQVQLAKGAIRSGIDALLKALDVGLQDVQRVEIAGSFGYHLSEKSLLNIKLLPQEFAGKIHFVGNTAIEGGIAFLLNTDVREVMADVAAKVKRIELANDASFQEAFVGALNF
ncbi:MAG: ASKHA domain-containing protein [Clostridiales bacterium]|nr:ASKHA domain-containing protein [Clostridiales bacterium]